VRIVTRLRAGLQKKGVPFSGSHTIFHHEVRVCFPKSVSQNWLAYGRILPNWRSGQSMYLNIHSHLLSSLRTSGVVPPLTMPLWRHAYLVKHSRKFAVAFVPCLSAFAKLRNATISFVLSLCLFVCPSVRLSLCLPFSLSIRM
jgi:hypothetical protein